MADTEPMETDAPVAGEEEAPRAPREKFSLDILSQIKQAQYQNGLRHSDYQRYRQYCSRRLRRVRKALKFQQTAGGKWGRYSKKEIEKDAIEDHRYLFLPLIDAERAWSYAMQLKDDNQISYEPRRKFHILKRLRRAQAHCEQLQSYCTDLADNKTSLEAEAYTCTIKGAFNLESENWQEALSFYVRARAIYEELGKIGDGDEQQLCADRVEELEPNVRFCEYNLRRKGKKDAWSAEDEASSAATIASDLQSKFDSVLEESRKKQAENFSDVMWRNKKVPIKSEKAKTSIIAAQDISYEVEKMEAGEKKVSAYERILAFYEEASKAIQADQKQNKASSKGPGAPSDTLLDYIRYIVLKKSIERLEVLAAIAKEKYFAARGSAATENKPHELTNMYEKMLQMVADISAIEGVEDDAKMVAENAAWTMSYRAERCFYMGESYLLASKWGEAQALFIRSAEHARAAIEHHEAADSSETVLAAARELESRARGKKCLAHAKGFTEVMEGQEGMVDRVEAGLSLTPRERTDRTLLNRINDFDGGSKNDPALVKLPPDFESVPCKAFMFDVALNHLQLPDLSNKVKKGVMGSLRGWFGR